MNPFILPFIEMLIATTGVLIALFWRHPVTPGLAEVMCPLPKGSAD
jgi:hypothetical protein